MIKEIVVQDILNFHKLLQNKKKTYPFEFIYYLFSKYFKCSYFFLVCIDYLVN